MGLFGAISLWSCVTFITIVVNIICEYLLPQMSTICDNKVRDLHEHAILWLDIVQMWPNS